MTQPMIPPGKTPQPSSPALSPNDHARTIIELLKHEGPELIRRWVAALLVAPVEERESIVEAIEQRITQLYGTSTGSDDDVIGMDQPDITVVDPVIPNPQDTRKEK
jgi:hypothetical protein